MTIKEYGVKTLSNFLKLMKDAENDKSMFTDEYDELKTILFNMYTILSTFVKYRRSLDSSYIHLGESDIYEYYKNNSQDKNRENEKGFVYIAKQTNSETVYKIGITNNIEDRRKSFKTGNAFIEMIASLRIGNSRIVEKKIHLELSSNKLEGEWFVLSKTELDNLIDRYKFSKSIE